MRVAVLFAVPFDASLAAALDTGKSADTLTFARLWEKVAATHPFAAQSRAAVEEVEAEGRLASLPGRPRLALETEDFLGTGPYGGVDAAVTTSALEWEWEPFGQRAARRESAAAQREAMQAEGRLRAEEWRAETLRRMEKAYWSDKRIEVWEERLRLADSLALALEARSRLGGTSAVDVARARLDAAAARRRWTALTGEAAMLRASLAALWGDTAVDGTLADPLLALPSHSVPASPEATPTASGVWTAALESQRKVAHEKTRALEREAWPSLEIQAGYRRFWSEEAGAWVAGVSMPLPFWNPAEPAVAAARARSRQIEAESRQVMLEAAAAEEKWDRQARLATREAAEIRERELPLADELWNRVEEGYRQGRYGITELLLAAEARLDLREAWWDAEGRAREAQIEQACLREKYGDRESRKAAGTGQPDAGMEKAGPGAQGEEEQP